MKVKNSKRRKMDQFQNNPQIPQPQETQDPWHKKEFHWTP